VSAGISNASCITAADEVLASAFGEEIVVLNLRSGVYYTLDEVAAKVWTLIASPSRVSAIRDEIVSEYDVDPMRCEHDIRELIQTLASHGLVTVT